VPRYFFDVHDGAFQRDDEGTECANIEEVRRVAKRLLPDIARDGIPLDGDRHIYTVLVTSEDGQPVYSAALSFAGIWLVR
jgi:hypothetical protein